MTISCFCTDTKDSQGVQVCNITEVAYNAVAVRWNPRDSPIKVNNFTHYSADPNLPMQLLCKQSLQFQRRFYFNYFQSIETV